MAMNNSIVNFKKNQKPKMQDIANKINYIMMERTDAIYDPEIWNLLDTIENNEENRDDKQHKIEDSNTSLLSTIPKETKKFKFPSLKELFNTKTLKVGNRKMRLSTTIKIWGNEIKVQDLSKINMESIYDERLITAAAIVPAKIGRRYVADERIRIYDFFTRNETEDLELEFDFFDQDKIKRKFYIFQFDVFGKFGTIEIDNEQNKVYAYVCIEEETRESIVKVCKYAKFIDEFTGSNLERPLFDEVGGFFLNLAYAIKEEKIDEKDKNEIKLLIHNLPIFNNLHRSYCNVEQYVGDTENSFRQKEEHKKKETEFFQSLFYRNNNKYHQGRQKNQGKNPRKISWQFPELGAGEAGSEETEL